MNLTDKIWATYCNMKFKGFVFGFLVTKYQRYDRTVNIVLAIASSGSIAAWAIWKMYPLIWSTIIAASQVMSTIKPYFPYSKMIKELNIRCYKMELLNIEYERFWNKIHRGKLTEDSMEQFYYDQGKHFAEVLNLPDDLVCTVTKDIEIKASSKMKVFLKNYHGIDIQTLN